ncbi:hypothetical protein BDZ88DRAFT_442790 [Geranomyces variabilis]|nr:hypothetical protein BDZ88DRAFT_442790 [Geranomyces variabilis]KAJ3131159.1 hypothetical protein HDU90_008689 [Geranomyces variabilis]
MAGSTKRSSDASYDSPAKKPKNTTRASAPKTTKATEPGCPAREPDSRTRHPLSKPPWERQHNRLSDRASERQPVRSRELSPQVRQQSPAADSGVSGISDDEHYFSESDNMAVDAPAAPAAQSIPNIGNAQAAVVNPPAAIPNLGNAQAAVVNPPAAPATPAIPNLRNAQAVVVSTPNRENELTTPPIVETVTAVVNPPNGGNAVASVASNVDDEVVNTPRIEAVHTPGNAGNELTSAPAISESPNVGNSSWNVIPSLANLAKFSACKLEVTETPWNEKASRAILGNRMELKDNKYVKQAYKQLHIFTHSESAERTIKKTQEKITVAPKFLKCKDDAYFCPWNYTKPVFDLDNPFSLALDYLNPVASDRINVFHRMVRLLARGQIREHRRKNHAILFQKWNQEERVAFLTSTKRSEKDFERFNSICKKMVEFVARFGYGFLTSSAFLDKRTGAIILHLTDDALTVLEAVMQASPFPLWMKKYEEECKKYVIRLVDEMTAQLRDRTPGSTVPIIPSQ